MRTSFLLIAIFWAHTAIGQTDSLDIKGKTSQYYIDTVLYESTCYTVTNNSSENQYFWLDKVGRTRMSDALYKHYFQDQHGDFTLMQLLTEHLLDSFHIVLFRTFIKKLPPQGRFEVILNVHRHFKMSGLRSLESHIVHFKESELPETYVSILKNFDDKLFKQDRIVIDGSEFK